MSAEHCSPGPEFAPVEAYTDEATARSPGSSKANGVEAFPICRLDQAAITPRKAVVQGIGFDEGAVATICGDPNAGKTAFAVSFALAISGGADQWLGLKIANSPVVYFAAEAPASVKMRARAAADRMDLPRPPALYISDSVPALGGERSSIIDAARIIATIRAVEAIEGQRVHITFIDTVASCLGDGDENGDGMSRLVESGKRIALETQTCVVFIHHPSKGGDDLRGHGSLKGACDSILRIQVDELTGVRTATLTKARDHAIGLELRFELEPVALPDRDSFGDPLTTIVVRHTNAPKSRPRPGGQRQRELLTELERRHRKGEIQWDEATVCKAGRDLGMPRNSPADALKGLIKAGYLMGSSASLTLKHPPEDTP